MQAASPSIERVGCNSQGGVPRSLGSVRWKKTAFVRCFGIEDQQHALARTEEDVPPRLFADQIQSKDIPIECLGLIEIIDVKSSLNEVLYGVHGLTNDAAVSRRSS